MYYTRYTKTSKLRYRISFRCQYCGAENETIREIPVQSSYNDKGFGADMDARSRAATETLYRRKDEKQREIAQEIAENNYKTIFPTEGCKNCKRRPVWAYSGAGGCIAKAILDASAIISVFVFLFMCLSWTDNGNPSFRPLLFTITPAIVILIWKGIVQMIKSAKIRKLDPRFLPRIEEL